MKCVSLAAVTDLSAQETKGSALETVNRSVTLESTKQFLDLRSCDGLPDPHELRPRPNTKKKEINLDLRSEDRSPRIRVTDLAAMFETSTISLRSDSTVSENCDTGLRDEESYSSAVVAMAPTASAAGPGEESSQELMELRESDLLPENENLLADGFVTEEARDQQSCRCELQDKTDPSID